MQLWMPANGWQRTFFLINKALDANEPSFDCERVHTLPALKPALKAFCDGGFMSSGQDMDRGGMQLLYVMTQATFAWFHGASVAYYWSIS